MRSTTTNSTLDVFHLPLPYYFQNNVEGDTYGVEFGANYQVLDGWRLHAGYDFLKENLHVKPGQTDINDALNETSDPENQFQIRSSMDLPHQVELGHRPALGGHVIQQQRVNRRNRAKLF